MPISNHAVDTSIVWRMWREWPDNARDSSRRNQSNHIQLIRE
jgi:hypothetical protein